jgi:hypothetical protein
MYRHLVDLINSSSRTRSIVAHRYPQEKVLFSTAATILETPRSAPIGWALRRVFQRHGNLVVTDRRVFIQSSFVSLIGILWFAAIAYFGFRLTRARQVTDMLAIVVASVFLIRRRPYSRDLPFDAIRHVQFGTVRGAAAECDIISIALSDGAIQLVGAQRVPGPIRELLQRLEAESPRNVAP